MTWLGSCEHLPPDAAPVTWLDLKALPRAVDPNGEPLAPGWGCSRAIADGLRGQGIDVSTTPDAGLLNALD
jgi:hypothetical protein